MWSGDLSQRLPFFLSVNKLWAVLALRPSVRIRLRNFMFTHSKLDFEVKKLRIGVWPSSGCTLKYHYNEIQAHEWPSEDIFTSGKLNNLACRLETLQTLICRCVWLHAVRHRLIGILLEAVHASKKILSNLRQHWHHVTVTCIIKVP